MDTDQRSVSIEDEYSLVAEPGSTRADFFFPEGDASGELQRANEVLTRVELDIACSSEKLVNLSVLMMHVATRESDFESYASAQERKVDGSAEKALEFDLLSGVLDAEVNEIDRFMYTLKTEIESARGVISSLRHLGDTFIDMEDKLRDSEFSLKQSQDQILEMKTQSADYQRILSGLNGVGDYTGERDVNFSEDARSMNVNAKFQIQTAEQQRHFLRMLEKSLAREMELEKKLTESRQTEEDLRMRLYSSEHDIFCVEEEAEDTWVRCFEAENVTEVLMGSTKELRERMQALQSKLSSSIQRETALQSRLKNAMEHLGARENALQKLGSSSTRLNDFLVAQTENLKTSLKEAEDKLILSNSEVFTLRERVVQLEDHVKDLEEHVKEYELQLSPGKASFDGIQDRNSEVEDTVEDLKEEICNLEKRALSAESRCQLLSETNMDLNDELGQLKGSGVTVERLESLEKQLHHAEASAEASQEKQNMLESTIKDMENLIEDLKSKVLKAEDRADSAEEKLIKVSESNGELKEELNFLRGRLQSTEASLHQAEETTMEFTKAINSRCKAISNYIMQLVTEREHIHQQLTAISKNKNILAKSMQRETDCSVTRHDNGVSGKNNSSQENDLDAGSGTKDEASELSTSSPESGRNKAESVGETEVDLVDTRSDLETVRRLDAGVLNCKHIFVAVLLLSIAIAAAYLFQQQDCPF